MQPSLSDIEETFALFDDWEERYRYVIELGRKLPDFPDEARIEANKVNGCASQVWVTCRSVSSPEGVRLIFQADSDAHIVRGLLAIILACVNDRLAVELSRPDVIDVFARLGLTEHLTPQRSNGVRAVVQRVQTEAVRALNPDPSLVGNSQRR